METLIFNNTEHELTEIIKRGGLVAVPTETVYGLAANGLDEEAVSKIYDVKGRPSVKPLSLMVSDAECMDSLCIDIPEQARILAERFWPGPLTIILKAKTHIPSIVLAGGDTVGLRCPDHALTLQLIRNCSLPLAAPSANPSDAESPKNAEQVLRYFDGKIEAVLDGGECGLGFESTIIDMTSTPYRILRQGALPLCDIEAALMDSLKIIGITGGTGCGKTTVLNELEDMGTLILDCDAIYHELLEDSVAMLEDLKLHFPTAFVEARLDRKRLGAIVFNDKNEIKTLNSITHKYIKLALDERLRSFAMNGGRYAAIDAIELFSSGLNELCIKTLAVLSSTELRVERIMRRDNISREYALMRINAQQSDEYFTARCNYCLYNNSDKESLAFECRKLFKEIIENG